MNVVDKVVSLLFTENTTTLLLWGSFENPDPDTVNVRSTLPTTALVGEIEMFGLFSECVDEPTAELQPVMPKNRIKHTKETMVVQKQSSNNVHVKRKILDCKFRFIQTDPMMFLHMNS